jgi:hypothetical protein
LTGGPTVVGVCVDDKRRPLAGVRIEATDARKGTPIVYSDAKGRFGVDAGRRTLLRATKPGHADVEVVASSGRRQTLRVTLPRLGAIDLPVRWRHGSGPVPDDIRMLIAQRDPDESRHRTRVLRNVARVEGGRLRAEGLPAGPLILMQMRGSVRANAAIVTVTPGRTAKRPTIWLGPGGTLEGTVVRDRKPVPGALVYLRGRGVMRALRADEDGEFRAVGLPPGTYSLDHPRQTKNSAHANERTRIDEGRLTKATLELR